MFITTEEALLSAVRKYGNGPDSKDYEFMVSIHMKRNLERANNAPYIIAFDLKDNTRDVRRIFTPTPEETIKIVRTVLKEDTPADFALFKGTIDEHEEFGHAFQVKRFIAKSYKNFNEDLLNYLTKTVNKFRPGEVSLIVIPELGDEVKEREAKIDFEYLKKNLEVPAESFIAVFVFLFDTRERIFQIFP